VEFVIQSERKPMIRFEFPFFSSLKIFLPSDAIKLMQIFKYTKTVEFKNGVTLETLVIYVYNWCVRNSSFFFLAEQPILG
jgi:hypothetical protein